MTRRSAFAPAVALAALWLACPPAHAARWPSWAEVPSKSFFDSKYGKEDAVVLLESWELALAKGARTGTCRRLTRILTEDGRGSAVLYLRRDSFQSFSKLKVWVLDPTGNIRSYDEDEGTLFSAVQSKILDDAEFLVLQPPGLSAGSTVAVEYQLRSEPDLPQDLFAIQTAVPVVNAVVKLDARKGWEATAKVVGGDNPGPTEVADEGIWEFRDVPGRRTAEDPGAPLPPRTTLAISYVAPSESAPFPDWAAVARWDLAHFKAPGTPSPAFDKWVESIRAAGGDPIESVGRAARKLRYFGIETGWEGLRPRTPETTLRRAFGDCKDKSLLMIEALRRLGVPAVPVLAALPEYVYVHEDLPSPFVFNHAIVGIPWEGRSRDSGMAIVESPGVGPLRLYDPTLSDAAGVDIDVRLEGGGCLTLDPRTDSMFRIPASTAADNVVEFRAEGRLDLDGTLRMKSQRRLRGACRRWLESNDGDLVSAEELRKEVFESVSRRPYSIAELQVGPLSKGDGGCWTYDYSYSSPNALGSYDDLSMFPIVPMQTLRIFPLPDTEHGLSAFTFMQFVARDVLSLESPGRRVVDPPKSFTVENPVGRVSLSIREEDGRLVIEREVRVSVREIPLERLGDAEALRKALRKLNGMGIVLGEEN